MPAQAGHRHLAAWAFVVLEPDAVVEIFDALMPALRGVDDCRCPIAGGTFEDLLDHAAAPAADGNEVDVVLAQLVEYGIGRQFAVEVQPVGFDPRYVFPVLDELQRQLVLLLSYDIGVGVACHGTIDGAGEEALDTRDGFASQGNVVVFQRGRLAPMRYGMEIQGEFAGGIRT